MKNMSQMKKNVEWDITIDVSKKEIDDISLDE